MRAAVQVLTVSLLVFVTTSDDAAAETCSGPVPALRSAQQEQMFKWRDDIRRAYGSYYGQAYSAFTAAHDLYWARHTVPSKGPGKPKPVPETLPVFLPQLIPQRSADTQGIDPKKLSFTAYFTRALDRAYELFRISADFPDPPGVRPLKERLLLAAYYKDPKPITISLEGLSEQDRLRLVIAAYLRNTYADPARSNAEQFARVLNQYRCRPSAELEQEMDRLFQQQAQMVDAIKSFTPP